MFDPKEFDYIKYIEKPEFTKSKSQIDLENVENYLNETNIQCLWLGNAAKQLEIEKTQINQGELGRWKSGLHPRDKKRMFKPEPMRKNMKKPASAFTDGVFKAVKSFSVFRNIDTENTKIYNGILLSAVLKVVKYAESLSYRETKSGKERIRDCKLLVAAYHHHTSRPTIDEDNEVVLPDPHEHFHLLFSRKCLDKGNEVKTVRNYFLYNNQILLGMVGRAYLATGLRKLGFEIVKRKDYKLEQVKKLKSGDTWKKTYYNSFEIKGFTEEMNSFFSKRSNDISKKQKEKDLENSSIARSYIASNNKIAKIHYDEDTITKHWQDEGKKLGIDKEFIDSLKTGFHNGYENYMVEQKFLKTCLNSKGKLLDKVLWSRLYENMMFTGIDAVKYYNFLLKKKIIEKTGINYEYKVNITLDNADKLQKLWEQNMVSNNDKCHKFFMMNYIDNEEIKYTNIDFFNNTIQPGDKLKMINTPKKMKI